MNNFTSKKEALLRQLGLAQARIAQGYRLPQSTIKDMFLDILRSPGKRIDVQWNGLFSALQTRGPSKEEVSGLLHAAAEFDKDLILDNDKKTILRTKNPIYVITGSGKDTWKTFNISTTASFIAAAAGVSVLKPGSDSVTSVSGAIEILKPLGLRYLEQQQDIEKAIDECGLAITSFHKLLPNYAKRYDKRFYSFHPLSYIMPVAAIPYKVEGISFGIASTNVDLSARLIKDLKIPKAIVMATENSNHDITDEYIEVGTAHLGILEDGKISTQIVKGQTPIGGNIIRHSLVQFGYDTTKNDHPIDAASVSKNEITILRDANETSPYKPGDSHHKNAEIILRTLAGTRHNPRTRAACRSAATLIYMSGKANNIEDAYQIAIETVESGKALETLKKYKQFCEKVAYKDTMETPNETLRIPRPRVSRSWSDKLNREDQKPKGTSTEKEVGR